MKLVTILSCVLLSSIFCSTSFAKKSPAQVDCLTIQTQYTSLIESGKYRYSAEATNDQALAIEYDKLTSYQEYLEKAYQVVLNKNPKANMPCPINTGTFKLLAAQNSWLATPKTAQLVAPFELSQANTEKAILLIHGLTDSPFSFHDLSHFFYQQGFTVRTLLLPGHGTAPSDLLDAEYSEWQQATKFAISQTLKDFNTVYLGGLSTGGALISNYLNEQQEADPKIKGVFLWSPASKAKNDFAWAAKYVNLIPFVDWIDLDADIDFAKYESFPYNAGAQVDSLMTFVARQAINPQRKSHNIPLFVVASEHDETIDTAYTMRRIQDRQRRSTIEQMKQSVLIYYGDKQKLPQGLTNLMKVIVPECSPQNLCSEVFDVSHISTTNSPENAHYGVNGLYRNCGHYLSDMSKYKTCKHNEKVIKGEVTAENLARDFPMQRLTYNPYYDEMIEEMAIFLQATN